jgi:ribosomal protein S18 acetylase RimI-like enzyme
MTQEFPITVIGIRQDPDVTPPRRATVEDLLDVAKIHRLAFRDAMPQMPVLHTPEEDLNFYSTGVFTSEDIWLVQRHGIVAGFIAFRPGWVDHLYVHPNCQRRGIGTQLLAMAQKSGRTLRAWTFQCNQRARNFYEKHGFRVERQTNGVRNEERQPDMLYVWDHATTPGIDLDGAASQEGGAVIVRRARNVDAPGIADLLTTLGYPANALQVDRRLAGCAGSNSTAVFVAESCGRVLGVLSFHCLPLFHEDGFLGRITSLVVAPDRRRRGIGRLLVVAAEESAWAQRCTRIEVTSGEYRTDAHAFYQRLGFEPDARRFIKRRG